MERRSIADVILALEPEMRELVHLREEVVKLRFKTAPPTPGLAEMLIDTPITLRQLDDGKWDATILVGEQRTGISGCATDVEVFTRAVSHLADLLAKAWAEEEFD